MFFYNESESAIQPSAEILPVPIEDPYFSNVSLLLKMDGTNGSTAFTDESSKGHTLSVYGNTQISTTQSKYGGASGYFDGTEDYLKITPATTDLEFGNEDYTVEFWMNPVPTWRTAPFSKGASNSLGADFITCEFMSDNRLLYALGTTTSSLATTTTFTAGQWYHIAVVRSGNTTSIYVNGTEESSFNDSYTISAGGDFLIGRGWYFDQHNRAYNGYIDDFRVTKGVARYTASFTPPGSHSTN